VDHLEAPAIELPHPVEDRDPLVGRLIFADEYGAGARIACDATTTVVASREPCPEHDAVAAVELNIRAPRHPITMGGMRREELQAIQSPLKQRYKEDANAGLVTLRADGALDSLAVSCSVQTGRALVEAGLHPASGGDGTLACSGDMLLQALVACAGVTLRSVAVNRGIAVAGGRIAAEGELDFRGTMGVDRDAPVGFRSISLRFELETDADAEELDKLIALTERYCVVYQTLARGVPVTITHERV
jgi:uncharacterized OsmC-like protein